MIEDLAHLGTVTLNMKVGECLVLPRSEWQRISPNNPMTGEPGIERLKSNVVGAAWEWEFQLDPVSGDFFMRKIEPDGKRRHVDWDRRARFQEVPDGTFVSAI